MNKKTSKFSKYKKWFISAIIGLFVIIIGVAAIIDLYFANKELKTQEINEKVYIYFGQDKFDFKGNVTLNHDGDITNLVIGSKETKLYSEPVYYANKEGIILPVAYSLVSLSDGIQKKVNYYTQIVNDTDDYFLKGKDLEYKLKNHVLFDGEDFYIFVTDAEIVFGEQNIKIPPLSYVNYIYDTKELYIYNYKEDKVYYYENVDGDVFVNIDTFKINLSVDTMVVGSKDKLLMKNFDYLKKLK